MNSSEIYTAANEVANIKGTNAKKTRLAVLMEDEDFREVLQYAMNPFKMFGIGESKIQVILDRIDFSHAGANFSEDTFNILDKLAEGRLSGNLAIEALIEEANLLNKNSVNLLTMILNKNLEMKVGITMINSIEKNFIKKFSCMLAHKYEPERNAYPVIVEEKLDGMRVLAIVKSGEVSFVSREGNPQPALEWMAEHVLKFASGICDTRVDMIFDGEVLSGSFNATVSEVRRKSKQAHDSQLHLFHFGLYDEFINDEDTRTMLQVKQEMQKLKSFLPDDSPIKILPHYFANNEEEIALMYGKVREKNGEGVIVKSRSGKYTNRRNHAWMKMKNKSNIDVSVVDWEVGTGEIAGMLGALIVDVDGVRVNVGSGFSRQQRVDIWENIEDMEGEIIEVSYHEKTPAGSLRHPVFEKIRADKSVPNTVS